jgi:hypothetical protein
MSKCALIAIATSSKTDSAMQEIHGAINGGDFLARLPIMSQG